MQAAWELASMEDFSGQGKVGWREGIMGWKEGRERVGRSVERGEA